MSTHYVSHYMKVKNSRHNTTLLVDSEWLLMQEQMDSGELELAKCRNWIIEPRGQTKGMGQLEWKLDFQTEPKIEAA